MAGISNIVIKIGAETAGAVRGITQVNKALGEQATTGQKASSALKKAAVPAGIAFAAAGAAILKFTEAGAADADAQQHLADVLKRTTGATDKQVKASEDYISSLSVQTATADDDLRPALEKLAGATGSVTKGQKQLATAVDISAQANVSLKEATDAMALADHGKYKSLQKLVPSISDATIATKDNNKIMAEAAKLTAGAGTESAKTYEGQMRNVKIQIGETEEAIGKGFLPVLQKFLTVITQATAFASQYSGAMRIALVAVMGVSGAVLAVNLGLKVYNAALVLGKVVMVAWTAVQKLANLELVVTIVKMAAVRLATIAWTVAQTALNLVLRANPIGLVITAITLLVAGIVVAYRHSDTFKAALLAVWNVMKQLAAYTPLGLQIKALAAIFSWASDHGLLPFRSALDAIWGAIQRVTDAVQSLIGWIGRIKFPSVPKFLSKVPGSPFSLPPAASRFAYATTSGGVPAACSSASASGGATINVYGALDPEGVARQIRRLLDAHDRRQGRTA
jgi:hypothetical protein